MVKESLNSIMWKLKFRFCYFNLANEISEKYVFCVKENDSKIFEKHKPSKGKLDSFLRCLSNAPYSVLQFPIRYST